MLFLVKNANVAIFCGQKVGEGEYLEDEKWW